MLRVATFAQEMTDADVRIVFYSTGEEMVLDNETSHLLAVMRGFASESERRKCAGSNYLMGKSTFLSKLADGKLVQTQPKI